MTRPSQPASDRRRHRAPKRRSLACAGLLALAGAIAKPGAASGFGPAANYALHCQGCHLEDGRATTGLVPALDDTVAGLASRPTGRDYLVRLPNVASAPLSDEDLAALLNWVVGRFASAARPRGEAFSAGEVAALRSRPLIDVEGARRKAIADLSR